MGTESGKGFHPDFITNKSKQSVVVSFWRETRAIPYNLQKIISRLIQIIFARTKKRSMQLTIRFEWVKNDI